ncbi:MAG: hypothetical protein ACTHY7_04405 [Marinobacter sp.]|uniref:hypothetical protein n=1 Tax=Marinobacter sp. TaxID=50741 RepID=UPI003F970B37
MKTLYLWGLLVLLIPKVCVASGDADSVRGNDARKGQTGRLSIKGISANVGEDEPRVLTILPWRAPTLPRRPRAELESSAPELLQALDPQVLERHREWRQ